MPNPVFPSGLDVAIGRPISGTDGKTVLGNAALGNILDGDPASQWCPSSRSHTYTLKIDLGADRRLTGSAITWASTASGFTATLEVLRGSQWQPVHSDSQPVLAWATRISAFDASARYVRLSVTGSQALPCIGALRLFAWVSNMPAMLIGHDLSTLIQLEDIGKSFSENGITAPAEQILARHHGNLVRLRLWVDPEAGFNNLAQVKRMALRSKAAGMKFLLDLHYSDTWADPGHQDIPARWRGQDLPTLAQSLREYTRDVIAELAFQGTAPDMVQVGNEITNGMLYPLGKIQGSSQDGFKDFATLLRAGIEGARAGMPANAPLEVMVHVDRGSNAFLTQSFFERITTAGVPFDVIGLSYYPYWNGPLGSLRTSIDGLAKRFHKPIVIAETAYPWTFANADGYPNIIGPSSALPPMYAATPGGQGLFLRDLASLVARTPGGLGRGLIYWESAWLAGIPWKPGAGNGWDNQTLFDANGQVLESLAAFD